MHGTTFTVTGENFVPNVAISPTLVYTSAGVTSTIVLTNVTPISDGSVNEGDFSAVVSITSGVAYSSTAVVSTSAQTPSSLPTISSSRRPVLSTNATGAAGGGGLLSSGPLGPSFVAGMTDTGSPSTAVASVTSTSGTYLGTSPISFTFGLSGTAGSVITPTAPVTTDASGVFTGSIRSSRRSLAPMCLRR